MSLSFDQAGFDQLYAEVAGLDRQPIAGLAAPEGVSDPLHFVMLTEVQPPTVWSVGWSSTARTAVVTRISDIGGGLLAVGFGPRVYPEGTVKDLSTPDASLQAIREVRLTPIMDEEQRRHYFDRLVHIASALLGKDI